MAGLPTLGRPTRAGDIAGAAADTFAGARRHDAAGLTLARIGQDYVTGGHGLLNEYRSLVCVRFLCRASLP